jgi:hypothetical protein
MTLRTDGAMAARDFLHMEVGTFLRRTQGRETFFSGALPGHPEGCIVKRTRHGVASWRPWRAQAARSAGRREHENLLELDRIGVRGPRALGWAEDEIGRVEDAGD